MPILWRSDVGAAKCIRAQLPHAVHIKGLIMPPREGLARREAIASLIKRLRAVGNDLDRTIAGFGDRPVDYRLLEARSFLEHTISSIEAHGESGSALLRTRSRYPEPSPGSDENLRHRADPEGCL